MKEKQSIDKKSIDLLVQLDNQFLVNSNPVSEVDFKNYNKSNSNIFIFQLNGDYKVKTSNPDLIILTRIFDEKNILYFFNETELPSSKEYVKCCNTLPIDAEVWVDHSGPIINTAITEYPATPLLSGYKTEHIAASTTFNLLTSPAYQDLINGKLDTIYSDHIKTVTDQMVNQFYKPTSDPIKNYKDLTEGTFGMEISLLDIMPQNRTLVIIFGSKDSTGEFKERATRLVGSLNTPDTIKVVVVTVNGDKVFSGLNFTEPERDGTLDPEALESVKKRFVQVLEVRNGGSV